MSGRRFLVKVCGMTRQEDIDCCLRADVDFLGFIFHPKSPRNIAPARAATLRTADARRVGVFVDQSADEVRDIMRRADLDYAQLSGAQDEAFCRAVGARRVIRVFRPEAHESRALLEAELLRYADVMSMALLDAGASGGGHGRTLDFSALAGLSCPVPWFLAGGLSPETLPQALAALTPNGFDLNSGLESAPGRKDGALVRAALKIIRHFNQ